MLRSPGRATRALLSTAAVAALAAATLAVTPAQAAAPETTAPQGLAAASALPTTTAATTSKPSVHVVTLVTGDRVVLHTDAAGRSLASFTPRSPHARKPFVDAAFNGHHYVVPKLPAAQQRLFDPSVFDVAALSGQARQTLDVTFRTSTTARSLPGLAIRKGSARTGSGGRTTVQATYDASRPLPAGFSAALGSVSRISVAGAATATPQLGPAYELHPLTINALTAHGDAMPFGFVFVLNMDDGRLFGAFGEIVDGQWKVQVPDGHYVVMVQDFSRVAVGQALVAGDTTTGLSLADATMKPTISFPGHSSLSPEVDLLFGDASGSSSSSFGFGGSRLPRLTPLAHLAAGTVYTEISNQWSTKGYEPFAFTASGGFKINPIKQIASAKQVRRGIPDTLSYRYDNRDFAVVDQKFYSTGAPVQGFTGWVGFSPLDTFVFFSGWPTDRPGRVKTMFLAHSHQTMFWLTDAQLTIGFQHFAFTDSVRRYPKPVHRTEAFFRGPLTPVVDRDHNSDASGLHCQLCVNGGKLRGTMSTLTTAGTTQEGFADTAQWALVGKRDLVAQGRLTVSPQDVPVTAGRRLTLFVGAQRAEKVQTLSTRVLDTYDFTVPSANGAVPILRADYVPPTDLDSRGPSGTVRFPVTFSNLGPAESRVVHAAVRYSVDGAHTWHGATLERRDKNTFQVAYPEPRATKRHRFVSLEVSARDAQGRRVTETVRNAYLLPGGRAGGAARATSTSSTTTEPGRTFSPSRVCARHDRAAYSCFVKLDARTRLSGKASPDPRGWGAPAIRDAYDLPSTGADTTVAVIVAYDYPSAEADLNRYRRQFGLPQCTSASGCFTKINQTGETADYPPADEGWGVEASLDLQMISTSCPTCHIVLAEANQPSDRAFNRTIRSAVAQGATVTNHSYGRIELTGDDVADGAYSIPGVTAVVASGDGSYGPAQFPASSPHVIAVGGTTLQRSLDPRGWLERAWVGGGSGCSAYFAKPAWQTDTACHARTVTDVSAVAHGLAIYNTSLPRRFRGWLEVDGTSASSPLIAGMVGSAGTPGLTPDVLYANAADFNDVVAGHNGFCNDSYLCTAGPAYDAPTGLGTPEGVSGFVGP